MPRPPPPSACAAHNALSKVDYCGPFFECEFDDKIPCELIGDFDGDGAPDRASLVFAPRGTIDIYVEWGRGGAERVSERGVAFGNKHVVREFSWLEDWEVVRLKDGVYDHFVWFDGADARGDALYIEYNGEPAVLRLTTAGWAISLPVQGL